MVTTRHQFASPLQLLALASAGIILLPLGYVTAQALSADPVVWQRLWTTRIPELLFNTVSLAASVAVVTLILGVSTAWLITRVEIPGRRLWEGALVLPLAMPTYVLAYVYSYLLGFGGPAEHLWQLAAGPQARSPTSAQISFRRRFGAPLRPPCTVPPAPRAPNLWPSASGAPAGSSPRGASRGCAR